MPKVSARTFKVIGNALICCCKLFCCLTLPQDVPSGESGTHASGHHVALAFAASFSTAFLFIFTSGMFLWWRYRHNKQIFFDVNDQYDPEVSLGHLKRYTFKELRSATNHFNSKNILGRGGYGIVYKGHLSDGTLVAVKRLKDCNIAGGEVQFQTEVETISLALHRNLLRLRGFCSSNNERILVYPYMPNGSVASCLKGTMITTAIHFDYGRCYIETYKGCEWDSKGASLNVLPFKTSSLDDITYSVLEKKIRRKIGVDNSLKIIMSYIPLAFETKRQSYICDDDDVLGYLYSMSGGQMRSVLHVEINLSEG